MQPQRRSRLIIGFLALGLLAGVALTARPAQAVDAPGPYYAEPAWDQKIAPANRFVVLTDWERAAVLDRETGLVWERLATGPSSLTWTQAKLRCLNLRLGNRKGWRLPSVDELLSLVNPTQVGPALPAGHPFGLFLPIVNIHWTVTAEAANRRAVWYVNLHNGDVLTTDFPGGLGNAWCVRGGNHAMVY